MMGNGASTLGTPDFMKILLVDNHTSRIPEWESLLSRYNLDALDTVRAEQLKHSEADSYDLAILTGAGGPGGFAVPTHMGAYEEELALIRERKKPLVGVCVGFQAIAVAFGSTLQYRAESVRGVIDIDVSNQDPIFGETNKFKAFVSHKYYVSEAPKEFIMLAKSVYNVEAFKHESRPIYGFQFHPEVSEPSNDGAAIFNRFIQFIVKQNGPLS